MSLAPGHPLISQPSQVFHRSSLEAAASKLQVVFNMEDLLQALIMEENNRNEIGADSEDDPQSDCKSALDFASSRLSNDPSLVASRPTDNFTTLLIRKPPPDDAATERSRCHTPQLNKEAFPGLAMPDSAVDQRSDRASPLVFSSLGSLTTGP